MEQCDGRMCKECIHFDEFVFDDGDWMWGCDEDYEIDVYPEHGACRHFKS